MSWPVFALSTGRVMTPVPVGSGVCGVGGGVGRMVCERVRCADVCSGVDWFPIYILGGREGGAGGVSTLGGGSVVFTGDGGGAVYGGRWVITLGAAGGYPLKQVGFCGSAWNMAEAGG